MIKTEYNKLIRDRIPEIITQTGKTCSVTSLSPNEYSMALVEKLVEEAQEAYSADQAHLLDEIADVYEVIDALLQIHGWQKSDLAEAQRKRRQERGGFEKRLKLLYIDDPSNANSPPQMLATYIQSLPNFIKYSAMQAYDHMGGLLTDAILQSGLNYKNVVLPRVQKILKIPEAKTTSGFLSILEQEGAAKLFNFKGKKPKWLMDITHFFQAKKVENTDELRVWLQCEENISLLKKQHGIKNKTADYFKILVGLPTSAPDTHIFEFLKEAGTPIADYLEAKQIIHSTADILNIGDSVLDYNIWMYMSTKGKK